MTHKPRKPKRKDTEIPQSSGPTEHVADEAIHKDSYGIDSGGGPRCQEIMGDTIAQTSFESVSKHSNDLLLAREEIKTSQATKIASLKRRVKKLKKKDRSKTHRLKRLYKVGLTARVESFSDEESLGEDALKQGRINAIDADEDITLVSVSDDDKEMFDVSILDGDEVVVKGVNAGISVVEEVGGVIDGTKLIVDTAQDSAFSEKVSAGTTASAATTVNVDILLWLKHLWR
ncbi:hypothetical protein Tco_1224828 [Tanacetum coccineum]